MKFPSGLRSMPIAVLPVGTVRKEELDLIDRVLGEDLRIFTRRLDPQSRPASHFDEERQKWDAGGLLGWVRKLIPPGCARLLAVIDVDLFSKERDITLGYADVPREEQMHLVAAAVYSPLRLQEEFYQRPANLGMQQVRSRTVIMHEIGHTCGIEHCKRRGCIMEESKDIATMNDNFCETCNQQVNQKLDLILGTG